MSYSISQRLHQRFVNNNDTCEGLSEKACKAVPDNFFRIVTSSFFTKLGDQIVSPKVTLAWLIGALGAPAYLVGLLVPIRESGALLPQFVIAGAIRRFATRKPVWVAGAICQAIAIAGIGLTALFMESAIAGWSIIGFLVAFSLARAFTSVASKDVLGKTIPKAQRGQTTGWSASAAGLVTLAVGGFMIWGAEQDGDVSLYAWLILLSAMLWLVAASIYSGIDECYERETKDAPGLLRDAISRLSLVREDQLLRRFIITRSLLLCSALSAPYYISIAQEALGSPASLFGIFIIASGLASMLSGPFWGRFSDRSSRQVMMISAASAAIIGIIVFTIQLVNANWCLSINE